MLKYANTEKKIEWRETTNYTATKSAAICQGCLLFNFQDKM